MEQHHSTDNSGTPSTTVSGVPSHQGCQHIFSKGKNKGNNCGCVIKKDNLCSKHKKIAVDNNLQKYGNMILYKRIKKDICV